MVSTKNTLIGKTAELLKKKKKPVEEIPAPTPWAPPQQEQPSEAPNPNVNRKILVTLPNGSTVFMGPAEYNDYIARGKTPFEEALTTMQEKVVIGRKQEALKPLISQIGQLTEEQKTRNVIQGEGIPGLVEAGAAGVGGAIVGAKFGAGAGAALAPFTGGASVPIGIGAGAITGFIGGSFTKVGYSKRQDVRTALDTYTAASGNMEWIINNLNAGKLDPFTAADMWDESLADLYASERGMKQLTSTDLNRLLSGGIDEMRTIEGFMQRLPALQIQFMQAMNNPNPKMVMLPQQTQELTE